MPGQPSAHPLPAGLPAPPARSSAPGLSPSARAMPRWPQTAAPASRGSRLVVRAEGGELAKADRLKGVGLYYNFTSEQALSYLDGTLPGDYGFDPLGLLDPEGPGGFITPQWLTYSEVFHCRWAMLGAAGCIGPEILAHAGLIPFTPDQAIWFRTGVIPPAGSYDKYWTDPYSLFFIEASPLGRRSWVLAMQFAELKRWQDYKSPGSQSKQYFLGIEQAIMTQEGPYQNLLDHLADPLNNNILSNFASAFR
eukprot:scaffold2.g6857.t1